MQETLNLSMCADSSIKTIYLFIFYLFNQMSGVMCHVSDVTCQVSLVRCDVSGVMFFFFFFLFHFFLDKVVGLVGGGSVINGAFPV